MSSPNSRASSNRSSAGRPIIHPNDTATDTRLCSGISYRPDSRSKRRCHHPRPRGAGAQPNALVSAQRPMDRTDGLDGALQGITSGRSPIPSLTSLQVDAARRLESAAAGMSHASVASPNSVEEIISIEFNRIALQPSATSTDRPHAVQIEQHLLQQNIGPSSNSHASVASTDLVDCEPDTPLEPEGRHIGRMKPTRRSRRRRKASAAAAQAPRRKHDAAAQASLQQLAPAPDAAEKLHHHTTAANINNTSLKHTTAATAADEPKISRIIQFRSYDIPFKVGDRAWYMNSSPQQMIHVEVTKVHVAWNVASYSIRSCCESRFARDNVPSYRLYHIMEHL